MVKEAVNTKPVGNLLDLMTEKHRELAKARFKHRMQKREQENNKVSSEMYLVAEFGYYFGWGGVEAIRKNEISLEEAFALLEGARKVWYTKLVESTNGTRVAVDSSNPLAKKAQKQKAYRAGMKSFEERARLQ